MSQNQIPKRLRGTTGNTGTCRRFGNLLKSAAIKGSLFHREVFGSAFPAAIREYCLGNKHNPTPYKSVLLRTTCRLLCSPGTPSKITCRKTLSWANSRLTACSPVKKVLDLDGDLGEAHASWMDAWVCETGRAGSGTCGGQRKLSASLSRNVRALSKNRLLRPFVDSLAASAPRCCCTATWFTLPRKRNRPLPSSIWLVRGSSRKPASSCAHWSCTRLRYVRAIGESISGVEAVALGLAYKCCRRMTC